VWLPETSAGAIVWPPSSRGTGHRSVPLRGQLTPSSVRTACARRAPTEEFGNTTVRSPRKSVGQRMAGSMACMESARGFGSRSQ
jgi:hypothetical protein